MFVLSVDGVRVATCETIDFRRDAIEGPGDGYYSTRTPGPLYLMFKTIGSIDHLTIYGLMYDCDLRIVSDCITKYQGTI